MLDRDPNHEPNHDPNREPHPVEECIAAAAPGLLACLLEQIAQGALLLDAQGIILRANTPAAYLLDCKAAELTGQPLAACLGASHRASVETLLVAGAGTTPVTLQPAPGRGQTTLLHLRPLPLPIAGTLRLALFDERIASDVLQTESLSQAIFHHAAVALLVCNPQGRIQRVNDAAVALLGSGLLFRNLESACPLRMESTGTALDWATLRATPGAGTVILDRATDRTPLKLRLHCTDLGEAHAECRYLLTLYEDGTAAPDHIRSAQHAAQQTLVASEARLRTAQAFAHVANWELDIATSTVLVSEEWFRIWGQEPGAVSPVAVFRETVHPDDRERVTTALQRTMHGVGDYHEEYRILRPDGEERILVSRGRLLRDVAGRPLCVFGVVQDITEQSRAQRELLQQKDLLDAVVHSIPDTLIIADAQRHIIMANPGLEQLFGYTPRQMIGQSTALLYEDVADYEQQGQVRCHLAESIQTNRPYVVHYRRCDGSTFPGETVGTAIHDRQGRFLGFLSLIRDVSERWQHQEKLELWETALASITEGVLITDARQNILSINRAFTDITGYTDAEVCGQTPRLLRSGRHDTLFYQRMWHDINRIGHWRGEIWNRRKDGDLYPNWLTINAIRGPDRQVRYYVGVFSDLTAIRRSQAQVEHLTHYDPLTDLPNRLLLMSRLRHALRRAGNEAVAVLFIDLDHFARLNESLGQHNGDRLLVCIAERWLENLPSTVTLARVSADDFVAVLEDPEDAEAALAIAESLLVQTCEPLLLDTSAPITITASIGIALYPQDATDAEALIRNAETALQCAKKAGRNRACLYDTRHSADAIERFRVENALRLALSGDEFFLDYQPQIELAGGRMIGVEALIRWRHNGVVMPPGRFIPVAEGCDLIESLGRWVLESACHQARIWLDQGQPLRVAVNVSSGQVVSGALARDVGIVLARSGLPPAWLELELVESTLIEQPDAAASALRTLKALGVSLALDDFGTGYSSLGYLKHYPFDVLKIDRLFIGNLERDPADAAIVRAIIDLAHTLGMRVLAEGVETAEQLRFLARHGCDLVQGFLLSRPMSPARIAALRQQEPDLGALLGEPPLSTGQGQGENT